MTLSRRDLEEGRMREVYIEALAEGHALTDEQLSESLTRTLNAKPKGAGWWVFAYGSLLWNPLFPFAESRRASVHGLHRRFCLLSLASRGTPDAPGLVLGLDRGGSCRGVAYRLPAPLAMDELHLLWRRESLIASQSWIVPTYIHTSCPEPFGERSVVVSLEQADDDREPSDFGAQALDCGFQLRRQFLLGGGVTQRPEPGQSGDAL